MKQVRWNEYRGEGPPPTRENFANEWDEMCHHYQSARYWLKHQTEQSACYLSRLSALVAKKAASNEDHSDVLILAASEALLAETAEDRASEIVALERLVGLIPRLLREWPDCPDTTWQDLQAEADRKKFISPEYDLSKHKKKDTTDL